MKIIKERTLVEGVTYRRSFVFADEREAGFSFPCDQNGAVLDLNSAAMHNYAACLTGVVRGRRVIDKGVITDRWHYWEPTIGLCACGYEVTLEGFTNTCDNCGADYNSAGQRLAPREQWGEETGESLSDILRIKW